jgi:hypothetical protein
LFIPFIQGQGSVSYQISILSLLEGDYRVSAAVVNSATNETYDYHDRCYHFRVYRGKSNEQYGFVTLNGVWEHDADTELVGDMSNLVDVAMT